MGSCSKRVLSIFALILGIGSLVGLIGALVVVIMWWTRIRYDYPYYLNETEDGYKLYVAVFCSWIFPIICFGTASLVRLPECCGLKMLSNLLVTSAVWAGIAELCSLSLSIYYSTPSACKTINQTTDAGRNTTEFQNWFNKQTKGKSPEEKEKFRENLVYMRCDNPHRLLIIYLSLFIGTILLSFIFVLISQWCTSEKHPELEQLTDDTKRTFGFD